MQMDLNNIAGFHIEPTNMCTLKCPGCARTRFIDQWPSHWKNHNIDADALFKFLNIDLTNKKINFCGNYGDPIYHPEFINIIKEFKIRGAVVTIVTNGSYRKPEWWQELCNLLTAHDRVIFSIDGIPENFTDYRVNADWSSIKSGIDVCVLSQAQIIWKYIPFKFNQNDINTARKLSLDLGMNFFNVEYSDRFDNETNHLKPDNVMLGPRYTQQVNFKNHQIPTTIDSNCKNKREHYISAEGFYMPCCYIGDHRFYYKTQFGKQKKQYSIREQTLSQILDQPATIEFYKNLADHAVCQYNCPSKL
jgi:MoaA/NifB/PqqE/SkfB family radical SAM enzyme